MVYVTDQSCISLGLDKSRGELKMQVFVELGNPVDVMVLILKV